MNVRFLIALLPLAAALAGCKALSSCNAPPTYGTDQTIPPLTIPEGLEAPDTRNALHIPDLKEPERPRGKSEPCLDEPPSFSAGWKPDEKAAGDVPGEQSEKKRRWWWPFGRG